MDNNPLGQLTPYPSRYAPELLFPIARAEARKQLQASNELKFFGVDIWTSYELSWLTPSGKPRVAIAEFTIPCDSEFIIESKSFKLYLNSLNQTVFTSVDELRKTITKDVSEVAKAPIGLVLFALDVPPAEHYLFGIEHCSAICLDVLDVCAEEYQPAPHLLKNADGYTQETLVSHLLKTNCPVTGQPDWASIIIQYEGRKISHQSLLAYLISFREHQDFHEHCVERIFCDLCERCKPDTLSVYARYTRRGGLDINPFRSTDPEATPPKIRLVRQ